MLNFGNKEFRNIQQQVAQNQCDIQNLKFGLNIVGIVSLVDQLPQNGKLGDGYLVGLQTPYNIYVITHVDPLRYTNIGTLESKVPGPKGDKGDTGKEGTRGSKWFSGGENPSDLENNYLDGDHYLNTITGDVFKFKDNKWIAERSIKGPQGMTGPRGVQGIQGNQGDQGPQGPQGEKGDSGSIFQIKGILSSESDLPVPPESTTDAYLVKVSGVDHLFIWADNDWIDEGPIAQTSVVYGNTKGTSYEGSEGAKLEKNKIDVAMVDWGVGPSDATNKKQFYTKVGQVFSNNPTQSIYMYGTPEELNNFFTIWEKPKGFTATHAYIAIRPLSNKSSRISFKMYLSSSNYGNTHEITVDGYNGTYLSDSGWISNKSLNVDNLDKYATKDGTFPKLVSGSSEGLIDTRNKETPTQVNQSFSVRETADGDPLEESSPDTKASILSVKGQAIRVIQNYDAGGSSGTLNGVSFTNNNYNSWTVRGTSTKTTFKIVEAIDIRGSNTHVYLIRGCPANGSKSTYALGDPEGSSFLDIGEGAISRNNGNPRDVAIRIQEGYNADSVNFTINIFDLTEMFGEGTEPLTVEEAYKRGVPRNSFPSATQYIAGTAPESLTSYGRNLWNEQWEVGAIGGSGQNVEYDASIRTKDFIKINLHQKYTINITCNIFYYTKEKQFISNEVANANIPFYIGSNVGYIKFGFPDAYGSTYKNDTMLNAGLVALPYEPYIEPDTIEIPDVGPLYGVNDVHDEITKTKYIKRFEVVDLGDYEYAKQLVEGKYRFIITYGFSNLLPPTSTNKSANMICSKYKTVNQGDIYWGRVNQSIGTFKSGESKTQIWIYDNSTTVQNMTESEFATYMKGQYLVYELATPVITTFDKEQDFDYNAYKGGIEELKTSEFGILPLMDFHYYINLRDKVISLPNAGYIAQLEERIATLEAIINRG